jgi:hypothetical protein
MVSDCESVEGTEGIEGLGCEVLVVVDVVELDGEMCGTGIEGEGRGCASVLQ